MRRFLWLPVVLLCGAWDPVTAKNPDVEEGNRKLAAGQVPEALAHYREAEKTRAGDPALHFDLGAALHQQAIAMPPGQEREGTFDASEKELRLALDSSDPRLRAGAHYNLGNTLFERQKYREAIDEYKKSLKLDPTGEDARHNLELALRLKQEPPPQPQPQPKPSPQQRPQPQPQPDQEGQKPQEDPADSPQQKPSPSPPPPQNPEASQGDQGKGTPTDLSAEDLERKLDALEKASKDRVAGKVRERSEERRRGKPVKDW